MLPRPFDTKLLGKRLANVDFWFAMLGVLVYIGAIWIPGITEGVMGAAVKSEGFLKYPSYLETVTRIIPLHALRAVWLWPLYRWLCCCSSAT